MSTMKDETGRQILERIARRAMVEQGFEPDYPPAAMQQVKKLSGKNGLPQASAKDLRDLLWASIDNDDSLDLDQLTVAIVQPDKPVRILIAVADVDALVKKDSPVDAHAEQNTTSIYTAGKTFHMLPEQLSTDLTSLNFQKDRPAMVVDVVVDDQGEIQQSDIYPAVVRNHAKLAYNSVTIWLEGKGPPPEDLDPAIVENLHIQDRIAQKLRAQRHQRGALTLQVLEAQAVFVNDEVKDLKPDLPNRAKELIEDFMIAANDATAHFLKERRIASLRRVVHAPDRWDRIVAIAADHNYKLSPQPNPRVLADFLLAEKDADPLRFPDLSLSIVKLLGSGEYVVEMPDETPAGHFGLAVKDYMHSTAPNRRFPDLITQRILKAVLNGAQVPYGLAELIDLAKHCTVMEDEANKIERMVGKSAAAMLLSSRIGNKFEALCTGAAPKGTWVRILNPPIEGRLLRGYEGVDVGDRLRVRLIHTDIEKGFIDFERVH